jgi:hypothetical protein
VTGTICQNCTNAGGSNTTLAVALVAVAISLLSLGWQILSWFLNERTRLDVTFEIVPTDPEQLTLTIVNRSRHDVHLGTIVLVHGVYRSRIVRWYKRRRTNATARSRILVSRSSDEDDTPFLRALSELPSILEARTSATTHIGGQRLTAAFPQLDGLLVGVTTSDKRHFNTRARRVHYPT